MVEERITSNESFIIKIKKEIRSVLCYYVRMYESYVLHITRINFVPKVPSKE